MTRRKRARARRARNAFARRMAQRYAARRIVACDAAAVRKRWPLGMWLDAGMGLLRGPERRRNMRAARGAR
jgi:hypothetical protein